ncbi:archaeosine biosynthesis radical SAM protein RaSEA [Thermodesulfobacteriota bacterium]
MSIIASQKEEDIMGGKSALLALHKALREIRGNIPKPTFNIKKAASSDIRIGYIGGKPKKRLVVTLRSSGCSWVESHGGCTMCGHYAGTTRGEKITEADYLVQFKREIAKYDFADVPILCLYNAGSVLNSDEISSETLSGILQEVSKIDAIKKVVFETRSEFVTEDVIANIKSNLAQDDFEIAIGLESSNEDVREFCLNKGLDIADFTRAVKLVKEHAKLRLYLMIKPIFLTEAEGIEDAVRSFNDSLIYSPDEVHFEPATIQEHTLAYDMYQKGTYRAPWLWSIIEVLKRIGGEKRAYVSPFMHMPSPLIVPHNCEKCTEKLTQMILEDYNRNFDLTIFDGVTCECRVEYEKELNYVDPRPLSERVSDYLAGC